jgi:hypothetical protein
VSRALPIGLFSSLLWVAGNAASAAEHFVAPTGDDAAAGTIDKPFATVQRAQAAAAPGDVVNVRGGTYAPTQAQIAGRSRGQAYVTHLDKSGEPGRPITYQAYKDERPVFDLSAVKPPGLRVDAFYVPASWVHLKGLEVVGVQVTITGHTQSICFANDGSHNVYERLSMHDGQAIGIYSLRGSDNLFLNCDAYRNWDRTSENGKGGNADGFGCHPPKGGTGNVFRGCRAWFNSDDGYDCINSREGVVFENCWAMYNGLSPDLKPLADGNGFKAGGYGSTPADRLPDPIPRHVVRGCLAVGNKANGFYANHHPGGGDWFNNSAFRNGSNFNLLGRLADNATDVDGYGHKLRNNLSYKPRGGAGKADLVRLDRAKSDAANNSFDLGLKLADADFVSLDEVELVKPRQPDGGLPAIGFMRPAAGGAMIDRGVDVGRPFRGAAPDLGAFEK